MAKRKNVVVGFTVLLDNLHTTVGFHPASSYFLPSEEEPHRVHPWDTQSTTNTQARGSMGRARATVAITSGCSGSRGQDPQYCEARNQPLHRTRDVSWRGTTTCEEYPGSQTSRPGGPESIGHKVCAELWRERAKQLGFTNFQLNRLSDSGKINFPFTFCFVR